MTPELLVPKIYLDLNIYLVDLVLLKCEKIDFKSLLFIRQINVFSSIHAISLDLLSVLKKSSKFS